MKVRNFVFRSVIGGALLTSLLINQSHAAPLKYPIPKDYSDCEVDSGFYSQSEMAFIKCNFFNACYLYDIGHKCSVNIINDVPPHQGIFFKLEPGEVVMINPVRIHGGKLYTKNGVALVDTEHPDYNSYKIAKDASDETEREKIAAEKEANSLAMAAEKKANSLAAVIQPDFSSYDTTINIEYIKGVLRIGNRSSDFVLISSISTYYNDKINTLYNLKMELPPEGVDTKGISMKRLFSTEMQDLTRVLYKNVEKRKKEITKFGFAIKYSVNGIEKKFYKVFAYNNIDLLKEDSLKIFY